VHVASIILLARYQVVAVLLLLFIHSELRGFKSHLILEPTIIVFVKLLDVLFSFGFFGFFGFFDFFGLFCFFCLFCFFWFFYTEFMIGLFHFSASVLFTDALVGLVERLILPYQHLFPAIIPNNR
jgi:hypothetical protein